MDCKYCIVQQNKVVKKGTDKAPDYILKQEQWPIGTRICSGCRSFLSRKRKRDDVIGMQISQPSQPSLQHQQLFLPPLQPQLSVQIPTIFSLYPQQLLLPSQVPIPQLGNYTPTHLTKFLWSDPHRLIQQTLTPSTTEVPKELLNPKKKLKRKKTENNQATQRKITS